MAKIVRHVNQFYGDILRTAYEKVFHRLSWLTPVTVPIDTFIEYYYPSPADRVLLDMYNAHAAVQFRQFFHGNMSIVLVGGRLLECVEVTTYATLRTRAMRHSGLSIERTYHNVGELLTLNG